MDREAEPRAIIEQSPAAVTRLAKLARGGVFLSTALLAVLHIASPEFNPITRAMSDYVNGRFGFVLTAALLSMGASLLVLGRALRAVVNSGRGRFSAASLAVAGSCVLIAGVFPIDNTPDGRFTTAIGAVHAAAGFTFSPAIVLAMLSLPGAHAEQADREQPNRLARLLAVLSALAFVALLLVNLILPLTIGGVGQRVLMGLVSAWLVTVSTDLIRAMP
jgi:hypothetical protein